MKKILTILIAATAILLMLGLVACNDKSAEEEILPANTISITTVADFTSIRDYLGKKYKNYTFVLENDIDLASVDNWTPIGDSIENSFCGTLDGNGKTVKNLRFTGWDSDFLPIIETLGGADGMENITSFSTMALFGYADSATFKNLNVSDVDFKYYADIGYSYVSGLVAYSYGDGVFENISVDGDIAFTNTYEKRPTFDNKGNRQDSYYCCDVTVYLGGVNAYSSGNTVFKNVNSAVDFRNDFDRAYYLDKNNAEKEEVEREDFAEKYIVGGSHRACGDEKSSPDQILAGGVCGVVKNGKIENATYTGNMTLYGKSIYAGGIFAAGYTGEISDASVTDVNINTYVHSKSAAGGIAALADKFSMQGDTVKNFKVESDHQLDAQTMSIGGIFGFACNLADVKNEKVEGLEVAVGLKESTVGGVGGVLREAKLSASECIGAKFSFISSSSVNEDNYASAFAKVVNSVYNNSVLEVDKECKDMKYVINGEERSVSNVYCHKNSTFYVDENGKLGIRLYEKNSTLKFVYVFAEVEEDGMLKVGVYNEELFVISEAYYDGTFDKQSENLAEEYFDVYFEEGVGFKTPAKGELDIDRDIASYIYKDGVPKITVNLE